MLTLWRYVCINDYADDHVHRRTSYRYAHAARDSNNDTLRCCTLLCFEDVSNIGNVMQVN